MAFSIVEIAFLFFMKDFPALGSFQALKTILAAADGLALFVDNDLCLRYCTPRAARLLQLNDTDYERPLAEHTAKFGYENLLADARQVLSSLKPVKREINILQKERYYIKLLPYSISEGDTTGLLMAICQATKDDHGSQLETEIALKEEAEAALQESQQETKNRLHEINFIYDTAPIGLCVLDREFRYVRINERLAEINGLSAVEHLGKTVREIVPDLADEAEAALQKIIDSGEPLLGLEIKGETPSQPGVERVWLENWFPFKDKTGEVIGVNIVAEEITEQRKIEAAAQETEDRYRQLFNIIEDGFCVCQMLLDEHGKPYDYQFLEVNPAFEANTGLKDATGKHVYELIPDLEPHWLETYAKVALQGESIRFEQGSAVMGRWFDVYAFPVVPIEGRKFAIQFKDITQRKQAEEALQRTSKELEMVNAELILANEELIKFNEELNQTNEQLKRVNADLDNFVYMASHDLKTPINNIEGLIRALESSLSSESADSSMVARLLDMVHKSVERFKSTLTELSQIARLQREEIEDTEALSIGKIIEEVKLDLSSMIAEAGAQFKIDVDNCRPINFSAKNMRSIVYNLISNAIKYRSPERTPLVDIRCEERSGYQVLTVTDNGLGMDMANKHKVFAMFQRLHDHVEGTGVGLYITKKVIDNAGGKIEVDSEVGVGTTFTVYFKQ